MLNEYIVEPAAIPWRNGHIAGISFKCQMLLSGADGGPEALHFRFDDGPSIGTERDSRLTNKGDAVRFILKQADLNAEAAAIVGDLMHDIIAGKGNGIFTVGVTYGRRYEARADRGPALIKDLRISF